MLLFFFNERKRCVVLVYKGFVETAKIAKLKLQEIEAFFSD